MTRVSGPYKALNGLAPQYLSESEGKVTCGQVSILGICALHLNYPSAHTHTHTAVDTHIVNSHPEQWTANAAAPAEQLGVQCLAQGFNLSRGIEGGEKALVIHTITARPETRLATFRLQVRLFIH